MAGFRASPCRERPITNSLRMTKNSRSGRTKGRKHGFARGASIVDGQVVTTAVQARPASRDPKCHHVSTSLRWCSTASKTMSTTDAWTCSYVRTAHTDSKNFVAMSKTAEPGRRSNTIRALCFLRRRKRSARQSKQSSGLPIGWLVEVSRSRMVRNSRR